MSRGRSGGRWRSKLMVISCLRRRTGETPALVVEERSLLLRRHVINLWRPADVVIASPSDTIGVRGIDQGVC